LLQLLNLGPVLLLLLLGLLFLLLLLLAPLSRRKG
jgi:hypothetical protein